MKRLFFTLLFSLMFTASCFGFDIRFINDVDSPVSFYVCESELCIDMGPGVYCCVEPLDLVVNKVFNPDEEEIFKNFDNEKIYNIFVQSYPDGYPIGSMALNTTEEDAIIGKGKCKSGLITVTSSSGPSCYDGEV